MTRRQEYRGCGEGGVGEGGVGERGVGELSERGREAKMESVFKS